MECIEWKWKEAFFQREDIVCPGTFSDCVDSIINNTQTRDALSTIIPTNVILRVPSFCQRSALHYAPIFWVIQRSDAFIHFVCLSDGIEQKNRFNHNWFKQCYQAKCWLEIKCILSWMRLINRALDETNIKAWEQKVSNKLNCVWSMYQRVWR